jgi:hypothetical protein
MGSRAIEVPAPLSYADQPNTYVAVEVYPCQHYCETIAEELEKIKEKYTEI